MAANIKSPGTLFSICTDRIILHQLIPYIQPTRLQKYVKDTATKGAVLRIAHSALLSLIRGDSNDYQAVYSFVRSITIPLSESDEDYYFVLFSKTHPKVHINWINFSSNFDLPDEFIMRFADYLQWDELSFKNLSFAILSKYYQKVNWGFTTKVYRVKYREELEALARRFPNYVNWTQISYGFFSTSEKFREEFADRIDWSIVSLSLALTDDVLIKFRDHFNWGTFPYIRHRLGIESLRELHNHVDWNQFMREVTLSSDFLREFSEHFNDRSWTSISGWCKLSKDFIRENADRLDWDIVTRRQEISESFAEEMTTHLNWQILCRCKDLSEKFIERNSYLVDWDSVFVSQKLSENFIIRNENRVTWDLICRYQKLSEGFIRRHLDKIFWKDLCIGQTLSDDFIREHANLVHWPSIFSCQKIGPDIKREFGKRIDF